MTIDLQFYPTPSTLAYKAVGKFKTKGFNRLLEPSAGTASLLEPFLTGQYARTDKIDCVEIDLNNQAVLRSKKLNVIDADFLSADLHGLYDKIIMNPPFAKGAEHFIKAFDLLVNGEIVAILNAETIKNPYSSVRKHLLRIIEDNESSVEFIEQAFVEQNTSVEVALIWINKKADIKHNFTIGLELDGKPDLSLENKQELAIRSNTIGNMVAIFNAAVKSLKSAEIAQEESLYYARLLGQPINQIDAELEIKPDDFQNRYNERYDNLKNRAWNNILNSTEFQKYLSSKAYQKLIADFEQVSKLSFTESNIRGFLLGLVESQGDMNMQMLLDTFDEITKYRPENRAYYRGWKSNAKHTTQAWQIKMTRFVIPMPNYSWSHSMCYEHLRKLADFDKTFCMLAGKASIENSLHNLFNNRFNELNGGARCSTEFFDVRYYSGVGTVHFYPKDKKLIDRFNRLVGRERAWLPMEDETVNPVFWKQYDKAEEITKAIIHPKINSWQRFEDSHIPNAHLLACEKLRIDVETLLKLEN